MEASTTQAPNAAVGPLGTPLGGSERGNASERRAEHVDPRYVNGPVYVTGSDPYGLDSDGDGVGCRPNRW